MDQARLDELSEQNAASWKQQAESGKAMVALLQEQADALPSKRQQLFASLYNTMLEHRRTSITKSTTDETIIDIAQDALKMALAVWPEYDAHMSSLD